MSDTTFIDGSTVIDADFLNDLNRLNYTILGDPANAGAIVTALKATQAQQETGTSTTVAVTPGVQQFHLSAVKFHGKCGVAGDLAAGSYNITSVSDRGPGQVDVVIATDFSSGNYYISCSVLSLAATKVACCINSTIGQAAGGFTIDSYISDGTLTDPAVGYFFAGAGDQV